MDDSLIPTERKHELDKRVERADKGIKYALTGVITSTVLMLIIVIVQLFYLIDLVRTDNATSHAKTQAYVLCIAKALTIPLVERTQLNLDQCTVTADGNTQPDPETPSTSATTSEKQTETLPRQEATTSEPLDPPTVTTPAQPQIVQEAPKGILETVFDGLNELVTIKIGG